MNENECLKKAMEGDIQAFQQLFSRFQDSLKSYLFRLTANRSDAEDFCHDAFIQAFDKIKSFQGNSSLRTWVFQIATNLTLNDLKRRKRWIQDVSAQAKELVMNSPELAQKIQNVSDTSKFGKYSIKEHIDTCFTCISKTLSLEGQITLILKDIYDFSIQEIVLILEKTEGSIKYILQTSRKMMMDIFDQRCALINKKGVCHQCSELNGWLNPKLQTREALNQLELVNDAESKSKEKLFELREKLVRELNPLKSDGSELQEVLMDCNRMAMGEL